ncbi:MAG TPA: polysaccharide biosynthesis protein [Pseudogracilibacillus sp.]|nr:polysaccharide biosynthesis protein [Pseudogracilibacillus sp.]
MSKTIVRGTMLLTGAAFLSKFLGMIYVIPFNELVGSKGGALYSYAYNPYTILISISTVGVPLATSKFISKYNSLGDYYTGMRMFRLGLILMSITGILSFLILFLGADFIAQNIVTDDSHGNSVADVKMVIRTVSFALLIIPGMSIIRGFFQGNQSMGPTAVSQVVEQVVRIIFVLGSAFIVIKIYNGAIATAVGFATFAAFVGAIASLAVLMTYWIKRKDYTMTKVDAQIVKEEIPIKDLILELFSYAGPFILVSVAIPLYQNVDTFTFNKAMASIGQGNISEAAFAAINLYGHKLVIIPVTLATGISMTVIPVLTQSFTNNDYFNLKKQINQTLQIVFVVVVPAVVGLAVLSYEAYGSIYGLENIELTSYLLAWYAPVALLFALYSVSAAILQGINQQNFAVVGLLIGFTVKIVLNTLMIQQFGAIGSILTTMLAVLVALTINLVRIKSAIGFSYKETFKRLLLVLIFSFVMLVGLFGFKYMMNMMFNYQDSRLGVSIILILGVCLGGLIYFVLAYKSTLLEKTLGGKIGFLERIFKRFRRG